MVRLLRFRSWPIHDLREVITKYLGREQINPNLNIVVLSWLLFFLPIDCKIKILWAFMRRNELEKLVILLFCTSCNVSSSCFCTSYNSFFFRFCIFFCCFCILLQLLLLLFLHLRLLFLHFFLLFLRLLQLLHLLFLHLPHLSFSSFLHTAYVM